MEMDPVKRSYTNGEVTVFWEPDLCNHAAICFRSLPNVFKPSSRPWIDMNAASTEEIIKTVKRCPTNALHYELNEKSMEVSNSSQETIITVLQDGPCLIDGVVKVVDTEGNETKYEDGIALCRCGSSTKKPFCDGTHSEINFKD
jgi:uncharacterized Fe-S cluster protein YjdI